MNQTEYEAVISRGAPHELDGALVEAQLFHPPEYSDGPKTRLIAEPRRWLCRKVWLGEDGTPYKYWLADPLRPNDELAMLYPTPNSCDLVRVPAEELGVLF